MFRQFCLNKRFKKRLGSAISVAVSVAMLVTALPADLLGGASRVEAAESAEYTATSGSINEYFTKADAVTDDNGNSKKYVQLWNDEVQQTAGRIKLEGKSAGEPTNAISFTVSEGATASVDVWAISANSTTDSSLALYDSDTKEVVTGPVTTYATQSAEKGYTAGDGNTEYGKKDNPITVALSASGLEGGKTYHLACPAEAATPTNIYYIRVVETLSASTGEGTPEGDGDTTDKDIVAGTYDFTKYDSKEAVEAIEGLSLGEGLVKHGSHGLTTTGSSNDNTMTLHLSQEATITVEQCTYGSLEVTSTSGKVEKSNDVGAADGGEVYVITGATGETKITFEGASAKSGYIHSLKVEYGSGDTSDTTDKDIVAGTYDFTKYDSKEAVEAIEGLSLGEGLVKHGSHGLTTTGSSNDNTMTLHLSQEATITVEQCTYGSLEVTSTSGKVEKSNDVGAADGGEVYVITGATGETKITFEGASAKSGYIHSLKVEYGGGDAADSIEAGSYSFSNMTEENAKAIKGLEFSGNFADWGNKHGFKAADADSALVLNLSGKATVVVTTCCYGNGNVTSSSGTVTVTDISEEGQTGKEYTVKEAVGKTTLTLGAGAYVHALSVFYEASGEKPSLDPNVPDVWDFGAQEIEGANNLATVDALNAIYPDSAPGTTGATIPGSFTLKDSGDRDAVRFVTDKTNNRLRTTNKEITRYDEKGQKDVDGNTYNGYLYSNNSGVESTRLEFYLYEGDSLTCWLGSNGNAATYNFKNPDGEVCDTFEFEAKAGVEKAVFHAAEDGWYRLYCTNEKLVCARIIREHAPEVSVSGSIDVSKADGIPAGYGVLFTNQTTGKVTEANVQGNTYSCTLYGGYEYQVSLKDAIGYVVKGGITLTLGRDAGETTHNLTLEKVPQVTVSGQFKGLPAEQLEKVALTFAVPEGYVFVPELTLDRATGEYTLKVEKGVEYTVTAENVNDYNLVTTTISASEDTSKDIEFEKKPVYEITVKFTGVEDASKAKVTFTNIDEEGYVYTFSAADKMELRDGRYSVKVSGLGNYAVSQGATANVNVNGAPASTVVPLEKLNGWDFAVLNNTVEIENIDGVNYYAGLALSGTAQKNKTYLLTKAGDTITVPALTKGDVLTISYCYHAAFKVGDVVGATNSGSTGKIESVTYTVPEDGDVVIESTTENSVSETYFCSIMISGADDVIPYAETLTVGADKDYKTINDALAAVRKMSRTADQNVTIMIDPGNYEEMLVIDMPNVTLKNASASPSIELKNKGVDIDDNAVRVTWYYGHGYTYYSMGPDCKYDANLLAVNKANGYASFTNPGSGTTNGSYWNASVVVKADNFSADGIIFENSFNQYVSAKSVEDVIEAQSGAKEGSVARAEMKTVGDTKVQEKEYVERAAALAIYNNVQKAYFYNCKFIGRQDTLYGGTGVTAGFEYCSVYGGTDYIFGGMTAVFKECDLVFNTNDQTDNGKKNDVGYITAAQQSSGRGYLMYKCTVTSTVPGVDTASEHTSKPGYFGRPWQANTGEAVFYETTVEKADEFWNTGSYSYGQSLIRPEGWLSSLGGESALSVEYGTIEEADVDNSAKRASWAGVLTEAVLADGNPIAIETFLGEWYPFRDEEPVVPGPDEGGDEPVAPGPDEGGDEPVVPGTDEGDDDDGDNGNDSSEDLDWNQVAIELPEHSDNMNVTTGGKVEIPEYVLQKVRSGNATLAMHVGKGLAFSVSKENLNDEMIRGGLKLTASVGDSRIPDALVNQKAAGAVLVREISMESHVPFGGVVNMHWGLGIENAGKYANLYRYNDATGQLEYAGCYVINAAGQAMFGIVNSAEYLLTVTNTRPKEKLIGQALGNEYVVKRGDTLSRIARQAGMSIKDILAKNAGIKDSNFIYVGQKIKLR